MLVVEVHPIIIHPRAIMAAPLSATMTVGALVLPDVTVGKIDASMMRRPRCRARAGAHRPRRGRVRAHQQVPTGWNTVPARCRKSCSSSASLSLAARAQSRGRYERRAVPRRRSRAGGARRRAHRARPARSTGSSDGSPGARAGRRERISRWPRLVGRQELNDSRNPGNGSGFIRRRARRVLRVKLAGLKYSCRFGVRSAGSLRTNPPPWLTLIDSGPRRVSRIPCARRSLPHQGYSSLLSVGTRER